MRKYKKNPAWDLSPLKMGDISSSKKLLFTTLDEWSKAKHRSSSIEEIEYLNSLIPHTCPKCESPSIIKNGKRKDGLQTYKCKICGNRFNILTNTIFDSHKIALSEWIEFLIHLFEFHSITTSARDNRNAESTGKYWLRKVFAVLEHYQDDVMLSGTVYYDETYLNKIYSVYELNKRNERIAIGVGCDEKNVLLLNLQAPKESAKITKKYFKPRIKEGSVFVHDGNYSHNELIKELKLKAYSYPVAYTKDLKDSNNPLDPINSVHRSFKTFMNNHQGFNREELQDWLNLFAFIYNPPKNRYEKILKFIDLAIKAKKVVRYRSKRDKK